MCCKLIVCILLSSFLQAAPVVERWCGDDRTAAHPDTLKVTGGGGSKRLVFDLSALSGTEAVYHAWLTVHKEGGQPYEPICVYAAGGPEGNRVKRTSRRLTLTPPEYLRFSATGPVRRWVRDPKTNFGFAVKPVKDLQLSRSSLEIFYEGGPRRLPPQVKALRAVHSNGQTFLVWDEHPAYRPKPGDIIWVEKFSERGDALARGPGEGAYGMAHHPAIRLRTLRRLQGFGLRDQPSGFQGIHSLKRVRRAVPVAYRVYRHTQRITASTIHKAERIASVNPLSGYDTEVYKINFKGEYLNQREEPDAVIPTYRTADGRSVHPGEALYVHTPHRKGKAYYAVTMAIGGTENVSQITESNSLARPVAESRETPEPVLQWIQEDRYRDDPPEYWYRFWAAPPLVNLPGRSFRIAVAVSDNFKGPGPLAIGTISGTFNVRGSVRLPRPGSVTLMIERQLAWLPALFYNEGRHTLRAATECRVDYFSERYMEHIIQWIMNSYRIDRSKISGSLLYFGLRHPELFPKMSFGTYTATYDYRWAPGSPAHLGPNGIKTVDGEDAWEMYSVGGYVLKYPGRDIPFLICISGTGKDRGHTSEFGWQDDPRGWAALLRARQPFMASWSGGGDPYRFSQKLSEVMWDKSIPAFSNCSLDNNPGNGDPADGDYYGQINGYLLWDNDVIDRKDRWEMTVFVTEDCRRDRCTVDLTPRHCRRFKPEPNERFTWTNEYASGGRQVQSGTAASDRWGLVTIRNLTVTKAKNRIRIYR